MSLTATQFYLGFVAAGTGLPAVALCFGYSKPIMDGLGRIPESWQISNECKFGLYLYNSYDIVLGMVCGASLLWNNNVVPTEVALVAKARPPMRVRRGGRRGVWLANDPRRERGGGTTVAAGLLLATRSSSATHYQIKKIVFPIPYVRLSRVPPSCPELAH